MADTSQALLLQNDYATNLEFQAQQRRSKLEFCVMRGMTTGAKKRHHLLGTVSMTQITERHQPTPYNPNTHDDRWTVQAKYVSNEYFDKFDELRTSVQDVTGQYIANEINAINRTKDAVILTALGGAAVNGAEGTGTQALPSGQKILVNNHAFDPDGGTADVGLTPYKIQAALAVLEGTMGDLEGMRVHVAMSAKQKQCMMSHTTVINDLYNNGKPMTTNQLAQFLGCVFHVFSNVLLSTQFNSVDGNADESVYVWLEDGVQVDFPDQMVETRLTERADLNFSWQCWASLQLGAVRLDDTKVVQIACDPTPVIVG